MARKPSQNQQADFSFRLQDISRKSKPIFHNSSLAIVLAIEAKPRRREEMTSQQGPREVGGYPQARETCRAGPGSLESPALLLWKRTQWTVISALSGLEFPSLHHSSSFQKLLRVLANTSLFGFCLPTILSACDPLLHCPPATRIGNLWI